MNRQRRPTASKNLGDDYRDAIGLEYVVRMLRDPSSVLWVDFESNEAGSLDDIVVGFPDRVEYIQAKYTVEEAEWSLGDLLEIKSEKSRSLLQKWAQSWQKIRSFGNPYSITIRSRRKPDVVLAELLENNRFKSSGGPNVIAARNTLFQHLASSGLIKADVNLFLADLEFDFENVDVEQLFSKVKNDFLSLGSSETNWNAMLIELRQWVRYMTLGIDGRIRVGDVRAAAGLWNPAAHVLPQEFSGDARVFILNHGLKNEVLEHFNSNPCGLIVLKGPPGSGKSHFLTWLSKAPPADFDHVFLHHCFVSLEDESVWERLDANDSAMSLLGMISQKARSSIAEPENPQPKQLSDWLRQVAAKSHARGKRILLVLDGLDHIVRERDLDEARKLLSWLPMPIPNGLWVVLGTQPVQDLLPGPLERGVSLNLRMMGFDEPAVREYLKAYAEWEPDNDTVRVAAVRSEGNPLYLHYLMESVRGNGFKVTQDFVEKTPVYGGGIESYYRSLWQNINPGSLANRTVTAEAQSLLALIGWSDFPLPIADLDYFATQFGFGLPAAAAAKGNVEHLLHYAHLEKQEMRIYHESLRRFVREQPEAQVFKKPSLKALLAWVRERADEETRWSAEWELELHLENPLPLLEGVTRAWAVEAINRHRSHQRLMALIRLAVDTAASQQDALRMFRIGWLIHHVSEAVYEGKREGNAITAHLRARLRLGLPQSGLQRALGHQNGYSYEGLAALAKNAFDAGFFDVEEVIFDRVNDGSRESYDSLLAILGIFAFDPARTVQFYRSKLQSKSSAFSDRNPERDWRRRWRIYLESLAFSEHVAELEWLMTCPDLDELDCVAVLDALVRLHVRGGDASQIRLLLDSVSRWSPYLMAVALTVGLPPLPQRLLEPFFVRSLGKNGANYADDGGWGESHTEILWTSVLWSAAGRTADLEAEQSRLAATGFHGGFLSHLIRFGQVFHQALQTGGVLDVVTLAKDFGSLEFPLYPSDDEYYPYKAGTSRWLEHLTEILELLALSGKQQLLSAVQVRALWTNSGLWFAKVLDWLEREGFRWVESSDSMEVVTDFERLAMVTSENLKERALWFAQTASLAAILNISSRTESLLRLSCENLLGHGYHKDMVLFSAIKSIRAAHSSGYVHAERDLLKLTPFVHSILDLTDGDETKALYGELVEALLEVNSAHAPNAIAWFIRSNDCQRHDSLIADYLALQPLDDPNAVALARTMMNSSGAKAAKKFFERRIEHFRGVSAEMCEQAETEFNQWLSTSCQPEFREQEQQAATLADASLGDDPIQGPMWSTPTAPDLIAWLSRQVDLEEAKEEFMRLLAELTNSPVIITRFQAEAIAEPWLRISSGPAWLPGELFDQLHRLLWRSGARELSFQAIMTAQRIRFDWALYYTDQKQTDARLEIVQQKFPSRLAEFVVQSAAPGMRDGNLLYMPRIVGALAKGGHASLAFQLTSDLTEFCLTLAGGLELPTPEWIQGSAPSLSTVDLMLERLRHNDLAVRTSTAKALASLVEKDAHMLQALVSWLAVEPLNSYRAGALLAFLLAARSVPNEVQPYLPGLRAALVAPTVPECLIFKDLVQICASSEAQLMPVNLPVSQVAEVELPKWYSILIQSWPVIKHFVQSSMMQRLNGESRLYQEAIRLGLNSNLADKDNNLLRQYWEYSNQRARFSDTKSVDLLKSSCVNVVTQAFQQGQLTMMDAIISTFQQHSIDGSVSALRPQKRPDWLQPPLEETHRIVTWTAAADQSVAEQLGPTQVGTDAILALDFQQVSSNGATGWRTEVISFAYQTKGELPEPEAIWKMLNQQKLFCAVITANILDQLDEFQADVELFETNDFYVEPLAGRLLLTNARWEAFAQLSSIWLPFLESPLLGDLTMGPKPLSYAVSQALEDIVIKGQFWQDGEIQYLYRNDASSANTGYWLTCNRQHLERSLSDAGLSLGWVKKTVMAVQVGSKDQFDQSEEYSLHNVLRIIR
jgi:hypothetical protein